MDDGLFFMWFFALSSIDIFSMFTHTYSKKEWKNEVIYEKLINKSINKKV